MICKACGKELEPGVFFCTNCGTPIEDIESQIDEPQQKPVVEPRPAAPQPAVPPQPTGAQPASGQYTPVQNTPAQTAQTQAPSKEQTTKNVIVPIVAGAVAGLALVGAFRFFAAPNTSTNSASQQQASASAQSTSSASNEATSTDSSLGTTASPESTSINSLAENTTEAPASTAPVQKTQSVQEAPAPKLTQTVAPSFANVIASSELEPDHITSYYGPRNATDDNIKTGWNEGSDGEGIGEWIELQADQPQVIKGVRIMAGYVKSEEIYYYNNRPTLVTITLSDGYSQQVNLEDQFNYWNEITFDELHETTSVRITIDAVNRGSEWNDTAITEIKAF